MSFETIAIKDEDWEYNIEKQKKGKKLRVVVIKEPHSLTDIEYIICGHSGFGFKWHRTKGPARVLRSANEVSFYINDTWVSSTREFCELSEMSDEETFMWVLRFGDELPDTCDDFYGCGWERMSDNGF